MPRGHLINHGKIIHRPTRQPILIQKVLSCHATHNARSTLALRQIHRFLRALSTQCTRHSEHLMCTCTQCSSFSSALSTECTDVLKALLLTSSPGRVKHPPKGAKRPFSAGSKDLKLRNYPQYPLKWPFYPYTTIFDLLGTFRSPFGQRI